MGRKKIEIRPLTEDRNRNVTFLKRKAGLMKKAWELSVLCHADVSMIIFSQQGKLFEFSSSNLEQSLERFQEYTGPVERKRGSDYASLQACGATEDSDDDDVDHPESGDGAAGGGGGGGGGGTGKNGKKGSTSVHSNLRGKEEWKNGSKPLVAVQNGNKGKRQRGTMTKSSTSNRRSSSPYEGDGLMIDANNSVPLMDRYGRRPDYVDGIGSSGMRSVGGLGGAVGYQEGSRKRQRSVEAQYGHRQYSTEPSHSSTPPPQPPMHSLYGSSARANGSMHQMDPSLVAQTAGYIGQPQSSSHSNGRSFTSGPGPDIQSAEGYSRYPDSSTDSVWHSEGQMAMQIQARLQAEQAQLHELRRQQAQNMEWQRRIQAAEAGHSINLPYPGGQGEDEFDQLTSSQGPGMDAFLAQLLTGGGGNDQQQMVAHAQAMESGGMITSRQWQPTATPSSTSSFESQQPPAPQSVADYLAMLRAGHQPQPPPSSMMGHQQPLQPPRPSPSSVKPTSSYVTGQHGGMNGEDSVRMPTPTA